MRQTATTIRIDAELKAEFDKLRDESGMSLEVVDEEIRYKIISIYLASWYPLCIFAGSDK